jgi:hypothetical protein
MITYFKPDTRVVINTIEGELHGVIISYRDDTIGNIVGELPAATQKPLPEGKVFVEPEYTPSQRIITIYTILLDGDSEPKEFFNYFIRPENDTTVQP